MRPLMLDVHGLWNTTILPTSLLYEKAKSGTRTGGTNA